MAPAPVIITTNKKEKTKSKTKPNKKMRNWIDESIISQCVFFSSFIHFSCMLAMFALNQSQSYSAKVRKNGRIFGINFQLGISANDLNSQWWLSGSIAVTFSIG